MSIPWLLLTVLAVCAAAESSPKPSVEPVVETTTESDLDEEGQDQIAILKQINRVNEDGSYTFGYEAADGSFKIETRDVAGNVKGMFGFVDEGGELKRVSYTASNGTGFQTTGSPNVPPIVTPADVESTTRINLFSAGTTKGPILPVYIYKHTTRAPRPEVIQHIPKLRPTPATISTEPTESQEVTNLHRPTFVELKPKKSSTPNYITLESTTASSNENGERGRSQVIQVIRPRGYKKVLVTRRPVEQSTTIAPVSSSTFYPNSYSDREEDGQSENTVREIETNSLADSGLAASGSEDSPDVYGGGPSLRPFPAPAYQTLYPQVPQYQRILQSSYLQNQLAAGGRVPPPPGQFNAPNQFVRGPYNQGQPPLPNQQNQISPSGYSPFNQGQSFGRYPGDSFRQQLPLNPGQDIYSNQPYPAADFRQQFPFLPQGQRTPNPQGPLPPDPRSQAGIPPPFDAQPGAYPPNSPISRQDPRLLNPAPFPQEPAPRPNPATSQRTPGQRLPPSSYNPEQGVIPTEPPLPNDSARRPILPQQAPPPPQPVPPYNQPYPPYAPDQPNPMLLMEQLIRMLLALQQTRTQQYSPLQQALLAALGQNNAPPESPSRNYDPRYQYSNYPQYQPRYPQYDPRYGPYQGYNDPYYQGYQQPARQLYDPYYQPNPYYSPNPIYQGGPEEALLRMFLGGRSGPVPQSPIPQIQNSPAGFDRSQQQNELYPRAPPPQTPLPEADPSRLFGQRIPPPGVGNIVERSPVFLRRGSSTTPRSTTARAKGSRNVQIIEEPVASESSVTTSKP